MDQATQVAVRASADRGSTQLDWLASRHTFSFGEYWDPRWQSFYSLRVINDDIVAPGSGFGMHGHRDMEIITVVLSGALQHRDSLGNGEVIVPGEVQVMTAGAGIRHSEFNPSTEEPVHLLQIWIEPSRKGLPPFYAQRVFAEELRRNRLCRVAGPVADDGALLINQDANLFISSLNPGASARHQLTAQRVAWLHVARGEVVSNGSTLRSGDAVGYTGAGEIKIEASKASEILLFDLAHVS